MDKHFSALTAIGLFAAVVLLGATENRAFNAEPYTHAQRLVNVGGGRRLNLFCTGSGSPTVLLDSDGHEGTIAWRYVQPSVARKTRVCSYDQAGFGFSDAAMPPRDASAFVRDLHSLIVRAAIARPYILVGYQPSGLYDRLFIDRYFHDVVGVVLVDPNETNRTARLTAVAPNLAPLLASVVAFDKACYKVATDGKMHIGSRAFTNCVGGQSDLPPALAKLANHQWEQPGRWLDYLSQDENSNGTNSAEISREQRAYGDLPLIVLTSDTAALRLPIPREQLVALTKARERWHDEIAMLSSRGSSFVVEASSDSIATDNPPAVVSAINEVIDEARKSSHR